ncbi:uncharacterized protein BO80DRAFT_111874 [Aspergillus ibericus CBS 121593]|uniref:Uncharacterized protein n=1 Tax=Aspergillus ibericus CBS 121593 TaxID=1448316 RepID=A0A395H109_9EURO|nr:hypothetical protein BO80DRAFT_111874 [Aspergillus ibericus CBS 121593]RAK99983.1 hypothetical protein BO80DRAFT_111874 [Aspergillus ibericus CBS 121593]
MIVAQLYAASTLLKQHTPPSAPTSPNPALQSPNMLQYPRRPRKTLTGTPRQSLPSLERLRIRPWKTNYKECDFLSRATFPPHSPQDYQTNPFSYWEEYWKRIFRTNKPEYNNHLAAMAYEYTAYREYHAEPDRSSAWVVEAEKWIDGRGREYCRMIRHTSCEYSGGRTCGWSRPLGIVFGFGIAVYLSCVFSGTPRLLGKNGCWNRSFC